MRECSKCETLPEPLPDSGRLYVCCPDGELEARFRQVLRAFGMDFSSSDDGVLEVPLVPGHLSTLAEQYFSSLSVVERNDTRCMILAEGEELTVHRLLKAQPLDHLLQQHEGGWLLEILREERLTTFFHPIVYSQKPTDIFAYECLARGRGRDGAFIPAGRIFGVARSGSMLFLLDRAARLSAIHAAHTHGITSSIFINFNPTAIYNPEFCLKSTVRSIEEAAIEPGRVVFEVVESDQIHDTNHLLEILTFYREAGFKVALDDLGAGYGSLNLMSKLRPDFVKLDMDLIRNVHEDEYKARICANLLSLARELGVRSVAEGVETHDEWDWLQEHGADLVQGYLFARPAAIPPLPTIPRRQSAL